MEASSGRRLLDPLGQGTRRGIAVFCRQRSHAITVHDSVPADCIEKVVSIMQVDRTFFSETFHASSSSEDGSQRCLAAKAAAARHTIKQRESDCGGKSMLEVKTETPRRTPIFPSLVVSRMPEHTPSRTCAWLKGLMTSVTRVACCLVAHHRTLHLTACFTKYFSAFLTPSLHSVPSQTTPITRPLSGIRSTPVLLRCQR